MRGGAAANGSKIFTCPEENPGSEAEGKKDQEGSDSAARNAPRVTSCARLVKDTTNVDGSWVASFPRVLLCDRCENGTLVMQH